MMAKSKTWTIVFLDRDGNPVPVDPGAKRFIIERDLKENQVLQKIEAVMSSVGRGDSNDVGLTNAVYVAGIWHGDVPRSMFPDILKKIPPWFNVYADGYTEILK